MGEKNNWLVPVSLDHPLHYVMFNSVCLCVEIVSLSGGDYVADSEDEASKNFKGRVRMHQIIKINA